MSTESPIGKIDTAGLDDATKRFVDGFYGTERDHHPIEWMTKHRIDAMKSFAAFGFPTRRHEDWRSTPLKRILDAKLTAFSAGEPTSDEAAPPISLDDACKISLVNGGTFAVDDGSLPAGVNATSLSTASAPEAAAGLFLKIAKAATPLVDLNTAYLEDALVLTIDAGAVVDDVIHIAHTIGRSTANDGVHCSPRVFVSLGEGAKARIVETFAHAGAAETFANAVAEIDLANGAHLEHVLVHDGGDKSHVIATTCVKQAAHSSYTERGFWLSGGIVRHDLFVALAEETAVCSLDGLAMADGNALVDGHYSVDHVVGHCESAQRFRTVLDGNSVGVFNGKVVMREGADKSDAQQENHNLLLSRDAEVFAKPQLEIFADDVKAAHGSTVGQLDEAALFYLRARGIGLEDAQRLLITAFAKSLVDDVQLEDMANAIRTLVDARLATMVQELDGGLQ